MEKTIQRELFAHLKRKRASNIVMDTNLIDGQQPQGKV